MFNSCETEKKTNNILYIIIIILLVIIAILAFFMGKNNGGDKSTGENNLSGTTATTTTATNGKNITLTIIDDKRCTNCMTSEIVSQLKQLPFFSGSTFVEKDYSDTGVADYLTANSIKYLPAVILSTNQLDDNGEMQQYLTKLADNQYSLQIGAKYDPLAKRSTNGFLLIDKDTLEKIKKESYLKGNKDAKISWIEYSDLECPYCAKLHNSDVPTKVSSTYGDKVNEYFENFPLEFHENAYTGALILSCLGEEKGSNAYYSLITNAYTSGKSTQDYLIEEAVKLGANKDTLNKCIASGKYDSQIKEQLSEGSDIFGINGTPGVVLINNDTLEYEVISGAYPFDTFKEVIDKLLQSK